MLRQKYKIDKNDFYQRILVERICKNHFYQNWFVKVTFTNFPLIFVMYINTVTAPRYWRPLNFLEGLIRV